MTMARLVTEQQDDVDPRAALGEILRIAAEMVRRTYADDVSDALDAEMKRWAQRLKNAHDAQFIVERHDKGQTVRQRPWKSRRP